MANDMDHDSLQTQLQQLPSVRAPTALKARLQASLEGMDQAPAVSHLQPRRSWIARPAWQAGLALAACSAMLFLWFFWLGERPPEATQSAPQLVDTNDDELSRLQAASADLEQVLHTESANAPIYGDDQAWVEHTLQLALYQVDADLAENPAEDEQVHLWTERVALLAGLADQSRGLPLGSGVEWVQLN